MKHHQHATHLGNLPPLGKALDKLPTERHKLEFVLEQNGLHLGFLVANVTEALDIVTIRVSGVNLDGHMHSIFF